MRVEFREVHDVLVLLREMQSFYIYGDTGNNEKILSDIQIFQPIFEPWWILML